MGKTIIVEGKTSTDAIEKGLRELKCRKNDEFSNLAAVRRRCWKERETAEKILSEKNRTGASAPCPMHKTVR